MGHRGLCTFDFLSLLITFALKLICVFTWMNLSCIGECVCTYVCVSTHMCVMNTFGSTSSCDMETSSFALQFLW